jgi:2-polyprenyl-3-methyl-5-hydroxy-6-metoxy-1,4-benzoquinol methylase
MTFSCPSCDFTSGSPAVEFGSRSVVACGRCGLLSTSPPLDDTTRRRRYDTYYSDERAARFTVPIGELAMRWFRRRRARVIARMLGGVTGKRVLDVGCGRGYTLHTLKSMGADVHGTQLSAPAARAAIDLIGADRIFVGELAEARYPTDAFDCVTLWHVLEHVSRPLETLAEVSRIVTPGGLVYIEVPNAGGWAARTFGADWLAYDIEHHVSHFTPATLVAFARRVGLERARETHWSLEYSPVTLTQTWLNHTLGGDSTLFRAVSVSSEPNADTGRVPLPVHALFGALLLPMAVAVSAALAAGARGDTVGVYFRKR